MRVSKGDNNSRRLGSAVKVCLHKGTCHSGSKTIIFIFVCVVVHVCVPVHIHKTRIWIQFTYVLSLRLFFFCEQCAVRNTTGMNEKGSGRCQNGAEWKDKRKLRLRVA